jgi:hypothetical protein
MDAREPPPRSRRLKPGIEITATHRDTHENIVMSMHPSRRRFVAAAGATVVAPFLAVSRAPCDAQAISGG